MQTTQHKHACMGADRFTMTATFGMLILLQRKNKQTTTPQNPERSYAAPAELDAAVQLSRFVFVHVGLLGILAGAQ